MSFLNIYYQTVSLFAKKSKDFKKACSQSDFDIVCITRSLLGKYESAKKVVNTDMFDIFRLDAEYNKEKIYCISGTFIAVRKHLSAYARREWMTEGVECVWITIPSRGCRSRLHVACVDFSSNKNIDPFTETVTSLSKTHTNDTFLVVGRFPLFQGEWISEKNHQTGAPESSTTGELEDEVIKRLCSCTSLAGLGQFNNIKAKNGRLWSLVFSSVPVTVTHCPRPLVTARYDWEMALQFVLDISPPEFCKTANHATHGNCRNILSGQSEAHREDVATSGELSELLDELVQNKLDGVTKLLPELIGEKFEQTGNELRTVQKECDRMSKENVSLNVRIKRLEDDWKNFAHIEECLKKFEDDLKKVANIEERLKTLEVQALARRERSFGFERTSTAYARTGLFGAAPQPSMWQFGQQTAALQTTGMFGSAGGMFGSATTQPTPAFGAMSWGSNTFGFGNAATQAPDAGLLGAMPTTSGFGLPQTMSSSSASGGVGTSATPVQPVTDFFSTHLRTSNTTATFGTTTPVPKEPNPLTKMPSEPHPTGIKLTRPGYYTIPSLDDLIGYTREDGSCVVPHFTVGRRGYGSVHYACEMDVAGLNLDDIVCFLNKEVVVYPEEGKKPAVGDGLNRTALVTLDRIWPRDKTTKQSITDPERLAAMDYESTLRRVCGKHGIEFIEYRPHTGSWVFKVAHFSKYGLPDYHEEEDALAACGAAAGAAKPEVVGAAALKPGEGMAGEAAVKKELGGPGDIEGLHSTATRTNQTTSALGTVPTASSKPNKTRILLTSALNSTATVNIPVPSGTSNVSIEVQQPRPGVSIGPTSCPIYNKTSLSESAKTAKDGETISIAIAFPAPMTYSKPVGTSFLFPSTSNSTARESSITSILDHSGTNMTTNNILPTTETSNVHVMVNILETMVTSNINGTIRNRETSVDTYEENPGSNEITTAVNTTFDATNTNKETTYRNETILDRAINIETNIRHIAAHYVDRETSVDTYKENNGSNEITTAVNTTLDVTTANKETTYRNRTILDQATNIDLNIGDIAALDVDREKSVDSYKNPGSNKITTPVNTTLDATNANKETTYRNGTIHDPATNIDTNIGYIAAHDVDRERSVDTYKENPGSNEITTAVNTTLDATNTNKETNYRNGTILDQATNIDTNIGYIAALDVDREKSVDSYKNPGSNKITTAVNTTLDATNANKETTYRNGTILDRATNIDTNIGYIAAHDVDRETSVETYKENPGSNEITTAVNTTLVATTANKETTYSNGTIHDPETNIDTNIGYIAAYDVDRERSVDTYKENPGSNEITTAVNTTLDATNTNKETTYRNGTILHRGTNIDTNIGHIAAHDVDRETSVDTYKENNGSNEITTAVNTTLVATTANKETTYSNGTIHDPATNIDTNIGYIAADDVDRERSVDTYKENPGSNEITTAVNTTLDATNTNKETTYRNGTILDRGTNIDTNIGHIAAHDVDRETSVDTYKENPGSNEIATAVNTTLDATTANKETTYKNETIFDRATNIDRNIGHIAAHDVDRETSVDTYEENPSSNEITTAVNTTLDASTANREATYRSETIFDRATNVDTNIGHIVAHYVVTINLNGEHSTPIHGNTTETNNKGETVSDSTAIIDTAEGNTNSDIAATSDVHRRTTDT